MQSRLLPGGSISKSTAERVVRAGANGWSSTRQDFYFRADRAFRACTGHLDVQGADST